MTSMRTLNRRLLRWRRYARRTCWNPRVSRPTGWGPDLVKPDGFRRAWDAQQAEQQRRADRAHGLSVWWDDPDGPWSEGDDGCCLADGWGHPGPCVTRCSWCGGDGRCPACGGQVDFCGECGGEGYCGFCDEGEVVEDDWIAPRPIVTIDTGGLT